MESLNNHSAELDGKFLELILNGALGAILKKQAGFAPGKAVLPLPVTSSESLGFNLDEDASKKRAEAELDSEADVSPVEITEWCNGLLGTMLILTSCTGVKIRKAFLEQFERLVMSSLESNIGKVKPKKEKKKSLDRIEELGMTK
jgi:hypothetical protein